MAVLGLNDPSWLLLSVSKSFMEDCLFRLLPLVAGLEKAFSSLPFARAAVKEYDTLILTMGALSAKLMDENPPGGILPLTFGLDAAGLNDIFVS